MDQHLPDLPTIDRVKVQAEVLVPILHRLEATIGHEAAVEVLRSAVGDMMRQRATEFVRDVGHGCARTESHRGRTAKRTVGLGVIVHGQFRGTTPHDLRHAAGSFAIASGASIKGVQLMLGHSSATHTLDRYAALLGDQLDAVAARIDDARQAAKMSGTQRGLEVVSLDRVEHAQAV